MATKSDFDETDWNLIVGAPMTASMIVLTASGGGTFRETFAFAKAWADARQAHGQSELLDEIVATKPKFDRHEFHTNEELHEQGLEQIGKAVSALRAKAPDDVPAYSEFVLAAAAKVAAAHKEDGQEVSTAEQSRLDEIKAKLAAV